MESFDANAAAKTARATPFKRPENMKFLPGSNFLTFFFGPTGDTNADAGNVDSLAKRGAWGSIFRVDLNPGAPQEQSQYLSWGMRITLPSTTFRLRTIVPFLPLRTAAIFCIFNSTNWIRCGLLPLTDRFPRGAWSLWSRLECDRQSRRQRANRNSRLCRKSEYSLNAGNRGRFIQRTRFPHQATRQQRDLGDCPCVLTPFRHDNRPVPQERAFYFSNLSHRAKINVTLTIGTAHDCYAIHQKPLTPIRSARRRL